MIYCFIAKYIHNEGTFQKKLQPLSEGLPLPILLVGLVPISSNSDDLILISWQSIKILFNKNKKEETT